MKDDKTLLLAIMAITILVLSVVGLTYAFFSAKIDGDKELKVNIETSSQAEITYDVGENLILEAKEPGYSGELSFSVSLKGDNKGTTKALYGIDLEVLTNEFTYDPASAENTPELVYSVYKSSDKKNWIEVLKDVDCTELKGTNHIITNNLLTTPKDEITTDYWKIVITYQSLDKIQNYNQDKNFNASFKVVNIE